MKTSIKRLYLKIVRQEGTPESIARGVAIGLTVGFILPIGLQTAPAIALAFAFKANKILSWSFTCVTNPASVFFIYPIQCYLGSFFLLNPLKFNDLSQKFTTLVDADSFTTACRAFGSLGMEIILPFFAGGILFALLSAPLGYWIARSLVREYQKRRQRARERRMHKQLKQEGK